MLTFILITLAALCLWFWGALIVKIIAVLAVWTFHLARFLFTAAFTMFAGLAWLVWLCFDHKAAMESYRAAKVQK